jgi:hypothetical protein
MPEDEERDEYGALKMFLIAAAGTFAVTVGMYLGKRYMERADPDSFLGQLYRKMYSEAERYGARYGKRREDAGGN